MPLTPLSPALTEITGHSLEWETLRGALRSRLHTEYGMRAESRLAPFPEAGEEQASRRRIGELWALEEEQGELTWDGVRPIDEYLARARKEGRLEGFELRAVLDTQESAQALARRLRRPEAAPLLTDWAERLHWLNALCADLARSITSDGELNEQAYPELAESRREVMRRRDTIHQHLEGLIHSRALAPMLQDRIYSLRGSRYVLPVKSDFRGQLPGIVHDVSASGQTLFVEPQAVVEETNSLLVAERRHAIEVDVILRRLSGDVGEAVAQLRENLEWLGRVDLLQSQARLGRDFGGTLPASGESGELALRGVAHPLMLLDGHEVVRNDVALGGATRCLVVSGANTGGKTVLLKAVGLSLLLAAHGMPIPALAGSRVDHLRVVADVGDQQQLSLSLSTFSAQIQTLAEMLREASPGTVILIDEILTGTEPQHGAALAAAALEELVAQGALVLVTSHYGELKALAGDRTGFANASVDFDIDRLQPTYRLRVGVPGASYAFSIARRHGLSESIVGNAERRLEAGGLSTDALLEQLQAQERRLHERELHLAQIEARASRSEAEAAQRQRLLEEREREVRRRERGRLSNELEAARRQVADVIRGLQQVNSLAEAGEVRERLRAVESDARASLEEQEATASGPAAFDPASIVPGTIAFVPSLRRGAEVEAVLDDGRTARLRIGAVTLEVPVSELTAPPAEAVSKNAARRASHPDHSPSRGEGGTGDSAEASGPRIRFILPGPENTLDLRGLRLHEALERLDPFFDLCVMKHISPVLLIHGHGTGRLKSGLRERLSDNLYVEAFRPGDPREGGDGVTVAALKL